MGGDVLILHELCNRGLDLGDMVAAVQAFARDDADLGAVATAGVLDEGFGPVNRLVHRQTVQINRVLILVRIVGLEDPFRGLLVQVFHPSLVLMTLLAQLTRSRTVPRRICRVSLVKAARHRITLTPRLLAELHVLLIVRVDLVIIEVWVVGLHAAVIERRIGHRV